MKVWIVSSGLYEQYGWNGVFSSKEKADEYVVGYKLAYPEPPYEHGFDIDETELDSIIPPVPSTVRGPIACRKASCDGSCGLRSIHYYPTLSTASRLPTEEEVRTFASERNLNPDRAVECCRYQNAA